MVSRDLPPDAWNPNAVFKHADAPSPKTLIGNPNSRRSFGGEEFKALFIAGSRIVPCHHLCAEVGPYPEGITASSPGLRRRSYPGTAGNKCIYSEGVAANSFARRPQFFQHSSKIRRCFPLPTDRRRFVLRPRPEGCRKNSPRLINTRLQPSDSRRAADNQRFQPLFSHALNPLKPSGVLLPARATRLKPGCAAKRVPSPLGGDRVRGKRPRETEESLKECLHCRVIHLF
jgi:hypothetical protein